jgi:methylmalonyl-CoA mutase
MSAADNSRPRAEPLLRDAFPPVDLAAWRHEVDRLLKGAPFDKALVATLPEGLRMAPLHTAADLADGPWGASLPGQAPYLRGTRQAADEPVPWLVAQELPLADPAAFNRALLGALERGQSAVHLVLDAAGRAGLDAAAAPDDAIGNGGTSLIDLADLRRALAGVDLTAVPVLLRAGAATLPSAAMLVALAAERGVPADRLTGAWGSDACAQAVADGADVIDAHDNDAARLTQWATARAPRLRTLAASDAAWHEAGADGVLSLGLLLAGAVDTLRALETRGLDPGLSAPRLAFHLSLDTDFFLEIARLRALRVLWADALAAAGIDPATAPAWIHARTGDRMYSTLDAHTNLLRATTAAMSAICGGADSLHVTPWDALLPAPGEAGRRLARNLHLILGHECRFGAVSDPAGGAWSIETLTREAGQGAWAVLQKVEAAGGLRRALRDGLPQQWVHEAGAARAARLARAQTARVGVNRFAAARAAEAAAPASGEAWRAVRRAAATATTSATVALDRQAQGPALMDALIGAAQKGATLGGLTAALRAEAAAALPLAPLPPRRDAEPYEALAARAAALAAREPVRARAHCLCLGDAGRTAARLDFARGLLAVGGFEVSVGAFTADPAVAVAEAVASGAAVVMLVAPDDLYPGPGAAAAARLAAAAAPPLVLVAGRPGEATAPLAAHGVTRCLHLGSDLVAELGAVLDALGAPAAAAAKGGRP